MTIFSTEPAGVLYSAPLGGGDAGPEQTIAMLRTLVDAAWKDPVVNRAAIDIIRDAGVAPYDRWGQVQAIYGFAKQFYFVNDPVTKEALRPTRELLKLMAGDCDDINGNVLPALLGTIGFESRLVTVASDPENPDLFSHVYAEVFIDGDWYPLDAARPNAMIGMAPSQFYRRMWWSLVDDSSGDYPAEGPMPTGMAGYRPQTFRGLGSLTSDLSTVLMDAGGALKSVSGQTVQSAVQPAIGPGGAAIQVPATQAFFSTPGGELLVGAGIIALLWLLSKD